MKITGKLMREGILPFAHKKDYLKGRLTPRIWVLIGDNYFVRFYNRRNGNLELIGEAEADNQETKESNTCFASDITDFIVQVEILDVFDRLIIIATPQIHSELNTNFSELVENKTIAEIHKNLNNFKDEDLKQELRKIIWF